MSQWSQLFPRGVTYTAANKAGDTFTGPVLGPTPPQFDNSQALATTAWANRVGLQYTGYISLSGGAATTLDASAAGALVQINGTNSNVTLPQLTGLRAGTTITFWSFGTSGTVVKAWGGDGIFVPQGGSAIASMAMARGDTLELMAVPGTGWLAVGGSAILPYTGVMSAASWTTQPQFDSSASLATDAFVQRALGNRSGANGVSTDNYTLTAAQAGSNTEVFDPCSNIYVPPIAWVKAGAAYSITNWTGHVLNVRPQGGEIISFATTNSNFTVMAIPNGTHVDVVHDGSQWWAYGDGILQYQPQFQGNSTYQVFPGGNIFQCGTANVTVAGTWQYYNFPVPFPQGSIPSIVAVPNGYPGGVWCTASVSNPNTFQVDVSVAPMNVSWMAFGR